MSKTTVKIKWNGPTVQRQLENHLILSLQAAGEQFRSETVRNVKAKSTRSAGPSPATGKAFSHADTGQMANSYFWSLGPRKELFVIMGTTLKHGLFQEIGTRHMAPRPNIQMTFKQIRSKLKRTLTKPLGTGGRFRFG